MNKGRPPQLLALGDRVALEIQELHRRGKVDDTPLLRIDHRKESADAPYQFDAVRGRLHRTGCRVIPASSKSALYGVWEFPRSEQHLACPRCKPMPTRRKTPTRMSDVPAADLVYGLLSILDQFDGVLRERGREYRRTQSQLQSGVRGLYESLTHGQRDVLQVIASALDGLSTVVNDLQSSLENGAHEGTNGHRRPGNGNGSTNGNGNGRGPASHGATRKRRATRR